MSAAEGTMCLTITHTPADGTLIEGTTKGDGTAAIFKATGWRWARTLGTWYVPRTRDHGPNPTLLHATTDRLRAAGHDVAVQVAATRRSAAEVEAATQERARARAAALDATALAARAWAARTESAQQAAGDRLPDNGHHSEPAHRRAIERADAAMRRSIDADQAATEVTRRAEVAAHTSSTRHNPVTVANRVDRLEAEFRSAQRQGRTAEQAAELVDQVTYWRDVRHVDPDHRGTGRRLRSRDREERRRRQDPRPLARNRAREPEDRHRTQPHRIVDRHRPMARGRRPPHRRAGRRQPPPEPPRPATHRWPGPTQGWSSPHRA
jgi:hypothetical protein